MLSPKFIRLVKKFGPFTLVVFLLFALKYLLISIYLSVHELKSSANRECEDFSNSTWGAQELAKNEYWRQFKMMGRGTYGFVQYSAYKISESEIVSIGFGAVVLRDHRRVESCEFHGNSGKSLKGTAKLLYPNRHQSNQYEVVIIKCTLDGIISISNGGYLMAVVDNEHIVLYREPSEPKPQSTLYDPLLHNITVCTTPINQLVDGNRLVEWINFHRAFGIDHVIAYDAGGMDVLSSTLLKPFITNEELEITPMREIVHYDIARFGELLAMHDCLYRSALNSKWVTFMGWDDYLWVKPSSTLGDILSKPEENNIAWLSHGSQWWSTIKCIPMREIIPKYGPKPIAIEQMVMKRPHYFCQDGGPPVDQSDCLGERGHRRIIANPRMVELWTMSEVVEPKAGVNLPPNYIRHNHYDSIHVKSNAKDICSEIIADPSVHTGWKRETND